MDLAREPAKVSAWEKLEKEMGLGRKRRVGESSKNPSPAQIRARCLEVQNSGFSQIHPDTGEMIFHPPWDASTRRARASNDPSGNLRLRPDAETVGIREYNEHDVMAGLN